MIWLTVALRNQGKSTNGIGSSSLPRKTQTQCFEMLVTSATKVAVPGIFNFLQVLDNDGLCLSHLSLTQSDVVGKFNSRSQPELGFAIGM